MAKVYGVWEYQPRPEVTEEEFEQAARDLVALPTPAGWRLSFGKADRGPRTGTYLLLFEIESAEVRDQSVTEQGFTSAGEQWFAENPDWVAANDRFEALAREQPGWADYVVLAAQA